MDQLITEYPYLWRFVKKNKIVGAYLEAENSNCIFTYEEVFDLNYIGGIFNLDGSLLELRVKRDGSIEDHVSLFWINEKDPIPPETDSLATELLEAVEHIRESFDLPSYFALFRIEYLEVLSDIKNNRNGYIKICNTGNALTPPTHCAMWLLAGMDPSSNPMAKLNRLKVYNAITSNSKIYIFKSESKLPDGGLTYKHGVIEQEEFKLIRGSVNSPKSKQLTASYTD
ncbi:Uncharacterised protein [Paucimonas lemoignei]|nr:Uncharacterised protein [Paucimonas lemoignei]